ncbi:succinate dehydrogenase/fumarate reductase flavoprotein subunit [Burkholderia sp. 567]
MGGNRARLSLADATFFGRQAGRHAARSASEALRSAA